MLCSAVDIAFNASATAAVSLCIVTPSHSKPSGSTTTDRGPRRPATASAACFAAPQTTGCPEPYSRLACHARNQPARKAARSLWEAGVAVGGDSVVMAAEADKGRTNVRGKTLAVKARRRRTPCVDATGPLTESSSVDAGGRITVTPRQAACRPRPLALSPPYPASSPCPVPAEASAPAFVSGGSPRRRADFSPWTRSRSGSTGLQSCPGNARRPPSVRRACRARRCGLGSAPESDRPR